MKVYHRNAALEGPGTRSPQRQAVFSLLGLSLVLLVGGCDKNQPNIPPVADAGPDQSIDLGDMVQLNGMGSHDPDGDALEYTWELTSMPSGSMCSITNPGAAMTSFEPDACTTYHVRLTVSDGKDFDTDDCVITVNGPPVADAGPDQAVEVGQSVLLDGSGSSDPEGTALDFTWSLYAKPPSSQTFLSDPHSASPTFTPDVGGAYVAELVVDDGRLESEPDRVTVSANTRPIAHAGADATVWAESFVELDGSGSTDPDGDALSYDWSFVSRPAGSAAALSNPESKKPGFTADEGGEYVVSLTVSDGSLTSDPDYVTITATVNHPPVAVAGSYPAYAIGDLVQLDGTGSYDSDGQTLNFSWSFVSRPSGSSAQLSSPASPTPSFAADVRGSYVVKLIVNDGMLDSNPDQATITVNSAPQADAGADQTVDTGSLVTLDGSGSWDADGDPLTYSWSFESRPGGSGVQLSNASSRNPSFTPDKAGPYVIRLTVNDGKASSAPDDVTVTAVDANRAPVADAGSNRTTEVGKKVTLDGTGSWDPDGDPLTYAWSWSARPSGSSAQLYNSTSAKPYFTPDVEGSYVVKLIVNDGVRGSSPDYVTVTANTANGAPSADAGPNQSVDEGDLVTLDGSGSYDPDGDPLTYSWSFQSRPSGSTATFSNSHAVSPTFTADVAGEYSLRLIVSDGQLTDTDYVTITATSPVSLTGTWSGPDEDGFIWTLALTENPSSGSVSGSADVTYQGVAVFSGGSVGGQRTGLSVELTITFSGYQPAVFTGTLSSNGQTMTGVLNGSGFEDYGLDLQRLSGGSAPRAEIRMPVETGSKSLADVLKNWKG